MPEIDARSVLIQLADDARPSKEEARINGDGGLLEKDGRGEEEEVGGEKKRRVKIRVIRRVDKFVGRLREYFLRLFNGD